MNASGWRVDPTSRKDWYWQAYCGPLGSGGYADTEDEAREAAQAAEQRLIASAARRGTS